MEIISVCVVTVVVVAILCCLIVMLSSNAKRGRQVEARVRSCEQKGEAENRLYYELEVDFYGANGEILIKTMRSGKKYVPGEVIQCRYLEKAGLLLEETTPEMRKKTRNSALLFLVIFLVIAGIVAAVVLAGGLPEGSNVSFGYLISILFMAVGVFGIYKKNKIKEKEHSMILLPGMQADYTVSQSTGEEGRTLLIYRPVYEYEWGGERRRIVGPVGSSGKKYRTIGRKVHILVDPHTGKAVCREDEMTAGNVYFLFGIIGLLVFILVLVISFVIL